MISNWRYDDDSSYAGGEVVTTKPIHNLSSAQVANKDYMRPYYMGYIGYDETPRQCLCTRAERTDEGDIVLTEEEPRNHGWGYVTCTATSGVPNVYEGYVNASGVVTRRFSTGTSRFINKAVMSRYATTNVITINLAYIVVPAADLDTRDSAANTPNLSTNVYHAVCPGSGYTMPSVTVPFISTDALGNGFDKFYTNEVALNFGDITVNGETINLSCKAEDFPDDNPTWRKEFTAGGTNYVLFGQLNSFTYPVYGRYRKAADETTTAVSIVPFIEHDCLETDDTVAMLDNKWISIGTPTEIASMQINIDWMYGQTADSVHFNTGYVSSVKVGMGKYYVEDNKMSHGSGLDAYWWCDQTGTIPGYGRDGILHGRHICLNRSFGDNIFDIFPMLRPKDIWYAIAPFHKIDTAHQGQNNTNPQNSYTATYSTEIFDNNVPTETRKQDTTANLQDELMDWQSPGADITEDEFIIDDMPAYEPSEDIMDKYTGDSIALNTGKFGDTDNYVTFWVLDKSMVNAFGERLWKNLLDFDSGGNPLAGVWQNVLIAGQNYFNTGSFDPSTIMDYIISLRYYPFELYSIAPSTTPNTKIYFGSGKYGVDVSDYPHKLSNLAIDIDAGVILIDDNDDFLYKDFRDYDGSTAVMYLPFCGEYQIPVSEIEYGTYFYIKYEVDILSGACTAFVVAVHSSGDYYPILVANGQCGFDVPLSATNANRLNAQILGDAQRTIGNVLEPFSQAASKIGKDISSAGQMIMGGGHADLDIDAANYVGAVAGPLAGVATEMGMAAPKAGMNLINQASDMVTRPAISMPLIQGSRGWAALANPLKPYIQLRRARYLYPQNYKHMMGKPECHTRKVSEITGYAECTNVDTSGLKCTEAERQMIKRTLETGFYGK